MALDHEEVIVSLQKAVELNEVLDEFLHISSPARTNVDAFSPLECVSRCAEVVVSSLELQMKTFVDECDEWHQDEGVVLPQSESPCLDVVLSADVAQRVVVTHVVDDVCVGKDDLVHGSGEQRNMFGDLNDATEDIDARGTSETDRMAAWSEVVDACALVMQAGQSTEAQRALMAGIMEVRHTLLRGAHSRLYRAAGRAGKQRRGSLYFPEEHHEGHRRSGRRRANVRKVSRVHRGGEVDTTRTNATTDRGIFFVDVPVLQFGKIVEVAGLVPQELGQR